MTTVPLQNMLAKIDRGLASRNERTRWKAAIALSHVAASDPEIAWPLVIRHGSRRHADVRMAIGVCVLEDILETHFDAFFPRVAATARSNRWFRDSFSSCRPCGLARSPRNIKLWRRLLRETDDKAI